MSELYIETKNALHKQISDFFTSQGITSVNGYPVGVYKVNYQNISSFPAVTLEIDKRRKVKKGLGVRELQIDFNVWVYTNIMDMEYAEEECLRIGELAEQAIEQDKTLGGTCQYLSIDDEADFGTVQNGTVSGGEPTFLQGMRIPLTTIVRIGGVTK
ncbi:tail terminator [Bacillus phage 056SW001B]|uniref:Tail terminator n=3 Tax=Gettysburgvirus TaxID=3425034 RepID=A0A7T8C4K3_9CAUD|nr:tail terminator [Bacillus phage 019DV002]QFG05250.1 tail terminator [Bacillus phage 019DV004]QFG05863.1 tail terminator [Bacillus phage 276BB001]QFG05944.1 tail terminator [Bacillus phage 280BB001]QFR56488.1 tail terminator [Bacillus phage 056SW001B]QQO40368.1 tail terminator [Bacillus phage 268TH004]QZA70093.1 tail terminator [Bacillus phage 274BB002]